MSKPNNPATIAELIAVVNAFNEAHKLHLQHGPIYAKVSTPFLDNLSVAATDAALALQPLVRVDVKTVPVTIQPEK